MSHVSSEELKAAWQKCDDTWKAAGGHVPCFEENYMKAREEYAELIKKANEQHLKSRKENSFKRLKEKNF